MNTENEKIDFLNILQQDRHHLSDVEIITGIKKHQLHKDPRISPELQKSWQSMLDIYTKQKLKRRTLRRRRPHKRHHKRPHKRKGRRPHQKRHKRNTRPYTRKKSKN